MPPVRRLTRGHLVGRAVIDRKTTHVRDLAQAVAEFPETTATQYGVQSALAVPLLRDGVALGVIRISRTEIRPFTDNQVVLLQTFADQAVIAIENVRLFNDTKEALERQTATAEILRVISSSPTDMQPVFDTIVHNAARLCDAFDATLGLADGDEFVQRAHHGPIEAVLAARYPLLGTVSGRAILEARVIQVENLAEASDYSVGRQLAQRVGYRTTLIVPLLREGVAIGFIGLRRTEVQPFTDKQIALLQTFADQAVIAIENVRLFTELQARTAELTRSVEQLTALRDVGHAVSSSLELETVLNTIVARAVQLAGANSGTIWEYDSTAEEFVLRITQNVEDPELLERRTARVRRGEGAVGRLALTDAPVQIPDITTSGAYEAPAPRGAHRDRNTRATGHPAAPRKSSPWRSRNQPPDAGRVCAEAVDLLIAFATQSALAIQNARLFVEIERKSRQLEVASQHKSEFLANMSHELRTPLNAIIGYSEMLQEEAADLQQDAFIPDLEKINAAAKHQLSLINDILDLAKIEAGRMELELTDFHLPTVIDTAVTLVRERAGRRGITLHATVDPQLGDVRADERKLKQVMLNLLSNAIKFTPEGGRIDVRAGVADGIVEVSVADTGVGIAPEDQQAVFEEFRQVGTADKKVEGTGLGLALSRKFVELHGGRIWVKSQVGQGSTFTFTLPVGRGE